MAYIDVTLPNDVADRIKTGDLKFFDVNGIVTYDNTVVTGIKQAVDYKRADNWYIEDNTEDRALLKWQEMLNKKRLASPEQPCTELPDGSCSCSLREE